MCVCMLWAICKLAHICKLEGKSHLEVLAALKESGMDSLPGAGAEILNDRVRRLISRGKCTGQEWLDVMRAAHQNTLLPPLPLDVWAHRNCRRAL